MSLTIQKLKAFITVAETLNFTKAAEQMYMTQPAYSRLILSLEKDLGVQLLKRTTRRVVLTEAGETCLVHARQVVDSYQRLCEDAERLRNGKGNKLKIGYNPFGGPPASVTSAIQDLMRMYSPEAVQLVQKYSPELMEDVRNGVIDCAIVWKSGLKTIDDLESRMLSETHIYSVIRESSPLARKKIISLKDLANERILFLRQTKVTVQTVHRYLQRMNVLVKSEGQADDREDLFLRVRLGEGIGFLGTGEPLRADGLAFRLVEEIENSGSARGQIVLVWKREAENPLLSRYLELLTGFMTKKHK